MGYSECHRTQGQQWAGRGAQQLDQGAQDTDSRFSQQAAIRQCHLLPPGRFEPLPGRGALNLLTRNGEAPKCSDHP